MQLLFKAQNVGADVRDSARAAIKRNDDRHAAAKDRHAIHVRRYAGAKTKKGHAIHGRACAGAKNKEGHAIHGGRYARAENGKGRLEKNATI